ncbi:uncharacterized protein [Periplaneta americana]|uniref:uncharacterized protein n=1 Tax=Periplaneta americana TaxID=6978 RepID=UPI0037E7D3D5
MPSSVTIILFALLLLIPVLTFWMWLLILVIHSSWLCPIECWCHPEEHLDCSHAALKEIPHIHHNIYHSPISEVNLDHNNLRGLGKEAFVSKNMFQIEYLSLKYCNISCVEVDAFKGLVLLRQLNLQHNLLTKLEVGIFKNMTQMTDLQLAYNRIENLEAGLFEGLASLRKLNLEHNLLNSLKIGAFIGLTNLSRLSLSHNRLTTLDPNVFMYLSKLNYLPLDGRKDLKIPSNSSFLNIEKVEDLHMSECNGTCVMPRSFENTTNFTVLDLSNNKLKVIDENIFRVMPRLRELLLYGNPLECDCGLLEVWRWCQEHDIIVGEEREVPRCENPEQLSGMWWGVLGKGQCTNGSVTFKDGYKAVVPDFVNINELYFVRYRSFVTYIHSAIFIFLFLFGTVGNVIILVVIICNSEMHTVPNVYIINLAVSDLFLLATNTILAHIDAESESWQLGEVSCKLFGFIRHSSIGVSAYLISVMSIQRYQAISMPLYCRSQSASRIVTIMSVLGVWTICSLLAIPYTLSMHVEDMVCVVNGSWKYYQKIIVFGFLVFCILPLGITVCMYCLTARNLMRSTNITSGEIHNQGKSRKSAAKTVLSFTIVFVVSFLPYHILLMIIIRDNYDYSTELMFYMYNISTYLLIFNSCFNPVALCCSSKCYRRYFKHYLLKWCGRMPLTTPDITNECVGL